MFVHNTVTVTDTDIETGKQRKSHMWLRSRWSVNATKPLNHTPMWLPLMQVSQELSNLRKAYARKAA